MRNLLKSISHWFSLRTRVEAAPSRKPVLTPLRFQLLPEFEAWTVEDVQALRNFMRSATGLKMVKNCGSYIHEQAMSECAGDKATPKAFGMNELLRWQFNLASEKMLSQAAGDTAANTNTTGGALDDALPVEFRRSF